MPPRLDPRHAQSKSCLRPHRLRHRADETNVTPFEGRLQQPGAVVRPQVVIVESHVVDVQQVGAWCGEHESVIGAK